MVKKILIVATVLLIVVSQNSSREWPFRLRWAGHSKLNSRLTGIYGCARDGIVQNMLNFVLYLETN